MSPRLAWLLSIALTLLVCGRLTHEIWTTRQTMDADEAVHAVESLRRYDDLERGEYAAFVRDCYFPERWQPPVQNHLRWYPIVHSLSQVLAFRLFEPSDFHARWPSILFLAATCVLFRSIARRIAPRHGEAAGLLAVVLLLAAPNVITFAPQSLIESCSLACAALALRFYVFYVEKPDSSWRALFTGLCLSAALLAKYDHGLLQVACLGLAELARQRWRVLTCLRSRAWLVFGVPVLVLAAWLAHPDKWQAFRDALSHPAFGSVPVIALNFGASWLFEYTTSPLVAAAALYAVFWALRRERDERLRAVAIYAGVAMLLLAVRARFQFRYNLVEAPFVLLLVASLAPTWLAGFTDACRGASERALHRWGWRLAIVGGSGLLLIAALALAPNAVRQLAGTVAQPVLALVAGPLGLTRSAAAYANESVTGLRSVLALGGWTAVATPLAFALLSAFMLSPALRIQLRSSANVRIALLLAAIAVLPGAVQLHSPSEFSRRIAWELECQPELNDVVDFVDAHTPQRARVLLAGGWDQLPNNALAWYLKTRRSPRPEYGQIEVVGDMIGSLVQPSQPRIRHWADVLARDQGAELPDRLVLIEHRDGFAYRIARSPDVPVYRAAMQARGGYRWLAARDFDELGCEVEIWMRQDEVPAPLAQTPALELIDAPRTNVGGLRWLVKDDAWRHVRDPSRWGAR